MQRLTFKSTNSLTLCGKLYPNSKEKCIIMAHGFTGNKEEFGRFTKQAEIFQKEGYSVFLFDFAGCGESDDTNLTVTQMVDDLKSAVNFARKKYLSIGIVAISLAGLVLAKSEIKDLKSVVLLNPVSFSKDISLGLTNEDKTELNKKGFWTKHYLPPCARKTCTISKKMIQTRLDAKYEDYLTIEVPTLLLLGGKDTTLIPELNAPLIEFLPEGSKLDYINDANHTFSNHLEDSAQKIVSWFVKTL